MDKTIQTSYKDEEGLHIDVNFLPEVFIDTNFSPEINMPVEVSMTEDDFNTHLNGIAKRRVVRIKEEITLYFAKRDSIREIAEKLGISKSQVHKDLSSYKQELLQGIKQDIRLNKLALGLLVDLTAQVDTRIRLLWHKYDYLNRSLQILGAILERTYIRLQKNPNARIKTEALKEASRETCAIIDIQCDILIQLRCEAQQLLNIYDKFGLTSADTTKLLLAEGVDIDVKVKEARETIISLIEIVKFEVGDLEQRKRIFSRLANDMRVRMILKHGQGLGGNYNEDAEFRI
ncbi:MAG: sporulation transcriptional regulator SpoIIID [Candidatus Omnitrophica bacterium]|nr:sporulation transcriptional regulator SpoIIID [Candidatus Omnitrophota bacterium]